MQLANNYLNRIIRDLRNLNTPIPNAIEKLEEFYKTLTDTIREVYKLDTVKEPYKYISQDTGEIITSNIVTVKFIPI